MTHLLVTQALDLRRQLETHEEAKVWQLVHPRDFDLARSEATVVLLDTSPGEHDEHSTLSAFYRLSTGAPFLRENHPRSAMCALLAKFSRQDGAMWRAARSLRGGSLVMERVREQVAKVARFQNVPVLVLGETGTGKEVVARAVHDSGNSVERPFVALNCAAIPANIFESELFGYAAGAFSGASKARVGLLEEAGTGTVFLDEIGDLPVDLQPKLLRVLEERAFRRVGSNEPLPMKARIVSATHLDVTRSKTLRRDLFYRLSGFTISLPRLAERLEDVSELARGFLDEFAERHGTRAYSLSISAETALTRYAWPGNVRELRVVLERAAILCENETIAEDAIHRALQDTQAQHPDRTVSSRPLTAANRSAVVVPVAGRLPNFGVEERAASQTLPDVERQVLLDAYTASVGNLSETARRVGLARSTVRDKLKRLGLL